jgi:hypothetical protein
VTCGSAPQVVSEMLGHASVASTLDIYSHVLPDMQQDAAAAIADVLENWRETSTKEVLLAEEAHAGYALPAQATPGLNQAANDGKFQFTVTSFSCGQSQLSNDNEFETATAQGQFCVLKLDIKNIGSEAQQFDNSAQYIYTSDGKRLSYATDGTTAANSSGSQCSLLPTINPGNSLSCNVAFDVPQGVTPTYAVLHDSSFSGGVKVALQ